MPQDERGGVACRTPSPLTPLQGLSPLFQAAPRRLHRCPLPRTGIGAQDSATLTRLMKVPRGSRVPLAAPGQVAPPLPRGRCSLGTQSPCWSSRKGCRQGPHSWAPGGHRVRRFRAQSRLPGQAAASAGKRRAAGHGGHSQGRAPGRLRSLSRVGPSCSRARIGIRKTNTRDIWEGPGPDPDTQSQSLATGDPGGGHSLPKGPDSELRVGHLHGPAPEPRPPRSPAPLPEGHRAW